MSSSAEKTVSSVTAVLVVLLGLIVLTLGPCSARSDSESAKSEQARVEAQSATHRS